MRDNVDQKNSQYGHLLGSEPCNRKKESKERNQCEKRKDGCCVFGLVLSFTNNLVNSDVNLV